VDGLPGTTHFPLAKIGIYALLLQIFFGQHLPLDAGGDKIENSVDDHAHIKGPSSSTPFCWGDQFSDMIPLVAGHIAKVNLLTVHSDTLPLQ
jgi:hypothetical protein